MDLGTVKQYQDWSLTGTVKDAAGAAIDLTGGGVRLTAVSQSGEISLDISGTLTDAAEGEYAVSVGQALTGVMSVGIHELELTILDSAGKVHKTPRGMTMTIERALNQSAGVAV